MFQLTKVSFAERGRIRIQDDIREIHFLGEWTATKKKEWNAYEKIM